MLKSSLKSLLKSLLKSSPKKSKEMRSHNDRESGSPSTTKEEAT